MIIHPERDIIGFFLLHPEHNVGLADLQARLKQSKDAEAGEIGQGQQGRFDALLGDRATDEFEKGFSEYFLAVALVALGQHTPQAADEDLDINQTGFNRLHRNHRRGQDQAAGAIIGGHGIGHFLQLADAEAAFGLFRERLCQDVGPDLRGANVKFR